MPNPSAASSPTSSDFAYSRDQFRAFVDSCLATAKSLGASDAVAEVSEGVGLSVSVRKGETENIERNRDKSISVTVYVGQRRGNASTSDFSASIAQGWKRSRSRPAEAASARSASSGRPAAGSSAVKRAMSCAARTVCSSAAAEKSEELALPRR